MAVLTRKEQTMKKQIALESITLVHAVDSDPDTSFLGEYTDDLKDGVIVRAFYE